MARGARGRGADKKKRGRKGWSENERAAHEKASQRMNDAKAAKEAEQAKAKEKEAKKRKKAFTNLLYGRNDADDSDEDDADSQNEVYPTELPGIDDDDDGACGNDGSGDVDGSDDDDDQQKMPADSAALGDDDDVGDKEPDEIMQILDHPPIVADMEDDEDDATRIGLASTNEIKRVVNKRRGDRGKDKQPRKKGRVHKCKRCQQYQPNEEERDPMCKGRGGSKHCQHYDEHGNIL